MFASGCGCVCVCVCVRVYVGVACLSAFVSALGSHETGRHKLPVIKSMIFAFRLEMHVRCDNQYKAGADRGNIFGQPMLFELHGYLRFEPGARK